MHSQNMLRDSPSARRIFGALCSPFLSVRGKTSCALKPLDPYFFTSCVHEGLGPLGSYLFWDLRFFGALNSAKFLGLSEVLFFLFVSCV